MASRLDILELLSGPRPEGLEGGGGGGGVGGGGGSYPTIAALRGKIRQEQKGGKMRQFGRACLATGEKPTG